MSTRWGVKQLDAVEAAAELEISTLRRNGEWRGFTPIWVVRVGDEVFVRSWHRRTTGWFGDVVAVGQARVRVPGVEAEVTAVDLGEAAVGSVNDAVDAAYRVKYGGGGTVSGMVTAEARGTTLRLDLVSTSSSLRSSGSTSGG